MSNSLRRDIDYVLKKGRTLRDDASPVITPFEKQGHVLTGQDAVVSLNYAARNLKQDPFDVSISDVARFIGAFR